MDHHNFTNTLSNIFRNLVPSQNQQQQSNDEIRDGQSESSSAVPDTVAQTPQTTVEGPSSSHTENLAENTGDVEMTGANNGNNDEDDEMPELQSVSDSDSEDEDIDEVEMQANYGAAADLRALENGGGGDHLMSGAARAHQQQQSRPSAISASSSSSALPRPNRRARVEDDDDEDRDRRHPSERVNAPRDDAATPRHPTPASSTAIPTSTPAHSPSVPLPPFPHRPQSQAPPTPRMTGATFPEFMNHFLQELRRRADPRQNQGPQGQQNPQNPQNPQPRTATGNMPPLNLFGNGNEHAGGFAISFDLTNGGEPLFTPTGNANAGAPPPGTGPGNAQGAPGTRTNPIPLDAEALFSFINMLNLFPMGVGPEVEDPERAKQLIDALEEVPVGLIRRMERVSEGVDLSGSGGDVNCAICWDRLLDSDGGSGWDKKGEEHNQTHADSEPANGERSSSPAPPPTSDDAPSSSSSAGTESSELEQPKIVSLPCAHVFHASCLVPWFSRPRQTTCPTCRFNIDPENLTYRPQQTRRNANANATRTQAPTTNAGTQTNAETQTQPPAATNPVAGQAEPATATAGAQTADRAAVEETVGTLERLRNALERRIDQVEAEERDIVERIMQNAEAMDDMIDEIRGLPHGRDILNEGPNAALGAQANANNAANPAAAANAPAPDGPDADDGPASILTIGFDVIIGTGPIPPMDDFPMGDLNDANPNPAPNPNLAQGQPAAQGPNAPQPGPRFGAPFGAGLRTGTNGNGVHWATGSGRTINEAFASLFANNNPTAAGAGGANPAPANPPVAPTPVVFGPPRPPPSPPQPRPAPNARPRSAPPHNGPMPEGFNIGQIFSRLFGGQRDGQGQGQAHGQATPPPPHPPTQQARAQGTPTQLPPFLNVNFGAPPTPNTTGPGPRTANNGPNAGPNAQPGNNNNNLPPLQQHFANLFGGVPGFPPGGIFAGGNGTGNPTGPGAGAGPRMGPGGGFGGAAPRPPRERKKWTLPAPPGATLRQRIEKAEREAGLRCFDVSCGVGPSDEEPLTMLSEAAKKQLSIEDMDGKDDGIRVARNVCTHTFHPSCLVSAARVSLMGEDATMTDNGQRVEVACSVCRSEGSVLKNDWDAGVDALK